MVQFRKKLQSQEAVVVPKTCAGRWIVWNRHRSKILGSGEDLKKAQAVAQASGEDDPGYEWIPPANRRIVGSSQ